MMLLDRMTEYCYSIIKEKAKLTTTLKGSMTNWASLGAEAFCPYYVDWIKHVLDCTLAIRVRVPWPP